MLTSQLPHQALPCLPSPEHGCSSWAEDQAWTKCASFRIWDTQLLQQLEGRVNPTAQEVPEGLGGPWEWLRGWALGGACSLAVACLEVLHRGGEGRAATLTPGSLPLTHSEHATEGQHRTFPMS